MSYCYLVCPHTDASRAYRAACRKKYGAKRDQTCRSISRRYSVGGNYHERQAKRGPDT